MKTVYGSLMIAAVCAGNLYAQDNLKNSPAVLEHYNQEYNKVRDSFDSWCIHRDYLSENYYASTSEKEQLANASRCVRLIQAADEINNKLENKFDAKRYDLLLGNYPTTIALWKQRKAEFEKIKIKQ